jgi:hypothetical protein
LLWANGTPPFSCASPLTSIFCELNGVAEGPLQILTGFITLQWHGALLVESEFLCLSHIAPSISLFSSVLSAVCYEPNLPPTINQSIIDHNETQEQLELWTGCDPRSHEEVEVNIRPSVSRSVCLDFGLPFFFFFENPIYLQSVRIHVGCPLWREDGSVIYCTISSGPFQSNHSWVQVPQISRPYFTVSSETPPTWRARSPYLYPPGTEWPSYTPWALGSLLSPLTTRRATVEVFKLASTLGLKTRSKSKSCYDWRSVSQYVLVSSPLWNLWPDVTSCLKVAVLSLLGALSDEKSGLSSVSHCHQSLADCQTFNIIYIVHVTCFK